MKTKEELNALKEEVELLNQKLSALTDEELTQVTGGVAHLDTNTDVDRSTIQKEIDASIQQIDDDALLPFNWEFWTMDGMRQKEYVRETYLLALGNGTHSFRLLADGTEIIFSAIVKK